MPKHGSFLSRFQSLDAYAKTLEDFRVRTYYGATLTIISACLIAVLLLSEYADYKRPEIKGQLVVDKSRKEQLTININVTFLKVPCYLLSVDVLDSAGEVHNDDLAHDIYKTRLDPDGNQVHIEKAKELGDATKDFHKLVNNTDTGNSTDLALKPYCGSCYGGEEPESGCCNTCEEVREAYVKKGWSFTTADQIEQCIKEGWIEKLKSQSKEGCNLAGSVRVNKVAGNFHFAPGKSFQQNHMHVHDLQPFLDDTTKHDFSHIIHHLSYGPIVDGVINPLDGEKKIIQEGNYQYQYFHKVVATQFHYLNGTSIYTNQFSVTQYERDLSGHAKKSNSHSHGSGLPGVFFYYEISPMLIINSEQRKRFTHFLTGVCAIIGEESNVVATNESSHWKVSEAKPAYSSRITMTEIISPQHADTRGFVFGGDVLGWIDVAAGTAAKKHAAHPCVTRSVDAVHFMHPIKVGDFLVIQACVNRAWNTSMEVGVRVETENPLTGKKKYCCHAYLTFVALVQNGSKSSKLRNPNPTAQVPRIIPTTAVETQRFNMAEERRKARISHREPSNNDGHSQESKMAVLRELMREWSKNTNTETMSSAEIPALLQEPEEYDNEEGSNDPANLYLKRRKSTLITGNIPQPAHKAISESFAEVVETVLPQHANTLQITFGGQIMKWMEQCCLISASRHARRYLLLASIDSLQFLKPTYVGDCITVRSMVSCTFHSSLEIYVTVEAENLMTGERFFTNDGFYTMVAVDLTNVPTPVPGVRVDKKEEYSISEGAEMRRNRRLRQRRELVQKELSLRPDEFQQYSK
ncbi:hypothetical protein G9A89_001736 [Geosiphon pyriformis]|nr:hypothetical protein G9A89_001736 [Geosiphon pyriformis]